LTAGRCEGVNQHPAARIDHRRSGRDDLEKVHGDVLVIWRHWTTKLPGGPIGSGQHVGEDNPAELGDRLIDFLSGRAAAA
jgi:hypothetical protein